MSAPLCRCPLLLATACVALLSMAAAVVANQVASPAELKAAFLVNFMKFTSWPTQAAPPGAPLVACIAGDDQVAGIMSDLTRGRDIAGRPIDVRRIPPQSPPVGCHVLFWSAANDPRDLPNVRALSQKPVLTVSDVPAFAESAGIVSFFVDRGKMRFAVNAVAAERAGLHISSRLLSLARIVEFKTT